MATGGKDDEYPGLRRPRLGCVILVALLVAVAFVITPPFLLPGACYDFTYGFVYPKTARQGDATFTDFGPRASHDRYVVDFGTLDLDRSSRRIYRFRGMPAARLGLEISCENTWGHCAVWELLDHRIAVGVQLRDAAGRVVVDFAPRDLRTWTWGHVVGEEHRAAAWIRDPFSYYRVDWSEQPYELTLTIVAPDRAHPALDARLQIAGGGWKSG